MKTFWALTWIILIIASYIAEKTVSSNVQYIVGFIFGTLTMGALNCIQFYTKKEEE